MQNINVLPSSQKVGLCHVYLLTIFQLYERHEKQGETDDFGINFVQKEKHKKIKGEYNKNFSQMESHDLF